MTYTEKILEKVCEKNCPDFNGMSILHLEQCDCSCHHQAKDNYNTELKEKIINSPKTFGLTDKEGRGGAILVEDILDILSLEDKLNK